MKTILLFGLLVSFCFDIDKVSAQSKNHFTNKTNFRITIDRRNKLPSGFDLSRKIVGDNLRFTATVNKISEDSIVFSSRESLMLFKLASKDVKKIEIKEVKSMSKTNGALAGFAIGSAITALIFASDNNKNEGNSSEYSFNIPPEAGLIYGGLPGALLGYILAGDREKWQEIPLDQIKKRNRTIGIRIEFFQLSIPLRF